MTDLENKLAHWARRDQEFADLLGLTLDQVLAYKEVDDINGYKFYSYYMGWQNGIYPPKHFVDSFKTVA